MVKNEAPTLAMTWGLKLLHQSSDNSPCMKETINHKSLSSSTSSMRAIAIGLGFWVGFILISPFNIFRHIKSTII